MYRIRFHGRGGQGIRTSSRILGTAFFYEGFEVQDAPVYGAERRGAPLFASVRADRAAIQERGLITHPDLVVVVDESLVPIPAANVLRGVGPRTVLLLNSTVPPESWRPRLGLTGPIVTLPASCTVESRAELARGGAMSAGAAARLVGGIGRAALERAVRDEVRDFGASVVEPNVAHALDAYDAVAAHTGIVTEGGPTSAQDYVRPDWIELPFELARIAAPGILAPATTVQTKTGAWRTTRPVVDPERCHGCTWICATLCPDSAISVTAAHRPSIDYDHCKGCLICVAVCPHHAIAAVPETGPRGGA